MYDKDKFYRFAFVADSLVHITDDKKEESLTVFNATKENGHTVIAAIGDSFMNGIFVAGSEIKKSHTKWNNTLHDINHMGSGYSLGFTTVPSNIEYIVGWQDGSKYDEETKALTINLHIEKDAPKFEAWENYVNISSKINRTPNVSVVWFAQIEYKQAKELPSGCGYHAAGYKADDLVPCMNAIKPFMVSTVTKGACDDQDGCGINTDCEIDKTKKVEPIEVDVIDKKIEEQSRRIEYLKNRMKSLKGE